MANVNYGDLASLENLGETCKYDYSTEQLLAPKLKNIDGESNIEVKERMKSFLDEILESNAGQRVAIVSHGAAIKFLLQTWCEFRIDDAGFFFEEKCVCPQKIASPSIIKLKFEDDKAKQISYYE